jgi:prepilin-type N-terminal cleavage/methylation domain-containing protein
MRKIRSTTPTAWIANGCRTAIRCPRPAIRSGFTLMELLVVIGIIVLLVALLVPSVGHFRKAMRKSAITTFMGSIQAALAGYEQDFKDLPPSRARDIVNDCPANSTPFGIPRDQFWINNGDRWMGSEIMTAALVGPLPAAASGTISFGDGLNGYGFMPDKSAPGRDAGRKSKAYLNINNEHNLKARWNRDGAGTTAEPDELWKSTNPTDQFGTRQGAFVLTMSYGGEVMPFLYFRYDLNPGFTGSDPTKPDFIFGQNGRFDMNQNGKLTGSRAEAATSRWIRPELGDSERESMVAQLRSQDYLLIHPGPNELYTKDYTDADKSDDADSDDDVYLSGVRSR